MSVWKPGVAFYSPQNKHSEKKNSDKRNVWGNRNKQEKYSFLAIKNVSEKPNIQQMIW